MIDDTQNIYTLIEFIKTHKDLDMSEEELISTIYLLIEEMEKLNKKLENIYEFYEVDGWEWEGDL